MAVFLISYDLTKLDFDYQPLYDALFEIGAKQIQSSVWGVSTDDSAGVIFDHLWQHMHYEKDRLLVISFDRDSNYKAKKSIHRLSSI